MTQQPWEDPFAKTERNPSLSWKDKPVGTRYVCKVLERPTLVQARDFETGEKATWDDGNPRMTAVVAVEVNGEKFSLWAPKPSSMMSAIQNAQADAGAGPIEPGGTLTVEYIGDEPNRTNPKLNPAKQYRAHYQPPGAFDSPTPQQQAQPAASGGWGGQQQASEPPF